MEEGLDASSGRGRDRGTYVYIGPGDVMSQGANPHV